MSFARLLRDLDSCSCGGAIRCPRACVCCSDYSEFCGECRCPVFGPGQVDWLVCCVDTSRVVAVECRCNVGSADSLLNDDGLARKLEGANAHVGVIAVADQVKNEVERRLRHRHGTEVSSLGRWIKSGKVVLRDCSDCLDECCPGACVCSEECTRMYGKRYRRDCR